MTNLALKLNQARLRQKDYPGERRAELRLVHDATAAVPVEPMPAVIDSAQEPRQGILARTCAALNKAFAFSLVVVALATIGIGCYVAGWNDRIMTDARTVVADIMDDPLRAPLQPLGDYDRITGERK